MYDWRYSRLDWLPSRNPLSTHKPQVLRSILYSRAQGCAMRVKSEGAASESKISQSRSEQFAEMEWKSSRNQKARLEHAVTISIVAVLCVQLAAKTRRRCTCLIWNWFRVNSTHQFETSAQPRSTHRFEKNHRVCGLRLFKNIYLRLF